VNIPVLRRQGQDVGQCRGGANGWAETSEARAACRFSAALSILTLTKPDSPGKYSALLRFSDSLIVRLGLNSAAVLAENS
jgi:hypothetical protein